MGVRIRVDSRDDYGFGGGLGGVSGCGVQVDAMIETPTTGVEYVIDGEIVCGVCGPLEIGQNAQVFQQTSPNRLIVSVARSQGGRGLHKVKRSTFRMNVSEET